MTRVSPWAALLASAFAAPAFASPELGFSVVAPTAEATLAGGCPQGTYDVRASADSRTLSVRFFDYRVHAGQGRDYDAKSCRLILDLNVPRGWSVGIDGVTMRAHASLSDSYASGTADVSYTIDWARGPVPLVQRGFGGPYDGDFQLPGPAARDRVQFTPCDDFPSKRLVLDSRIAVSATGFSDAEVREHRLDGAVAHDYNIVWMQCPQPPPPPPPPPPRDWVGTCRVVLETVWGQDLQDFWGRGYGRTQAEALANSRDDGSAQCQRARGNDSLKKCTVDNGQCTASQG